MHTSAELRSLLVVRRRRAAGSCARRGDAHRGGELAAVFEECGQLRGLSRAVNDLDVVDLVGLEQQERARAVTWCVELGEEEGIPSGHDAVSDKPTGIPVVRVEPVSLPRVVPEDDVGAPAPDPGSHLEALPDAAFELAIGPAEERHIVSSTESPGGSALLGAPRGHELRRILGRIPCALGPVRADEEEDRAPTGGPFRQRGSAAELDVVRMGANGESARRYREVESRSGGDGRGRLRRAQKADAARSWRRWRSSGRSTSAPSRRSRTTTHGRPSLAASARWRSNEPGP